MKEIFEKYNTTIRMLETAHIESPIRFTRKKNLYINQTKL